jgi:F-type H+-transporting ATPase subunit b
MDSIMSLEIGLLFWTLLIFGILVFIFKNFGLTAIINSIEGAEAANAKAQELLKESEVKLSQAQAEMSSLISKGRKQAEDIVKAAADDADAVKRQKIKESIDAIEQSKNNAIKELREEVAGLAVAAAEVILGETLDKDKHAKIAASYIDKLPKN